MSKTAPAPASGDVVVSRNALKDVLVELAGLHRHYQTCGIFRSNGECDCGMANTIRSLQAMLASAPRPSGDVAEKLWEIRKRLDAVVSQFGVAWAYESCGEKGDGSNIIGTMFHPDDDNVERPLLGYCAPIYDEDARDFREYYRDELIAEVEHRNRGSGAIAEFISHAPSDITTLLERIATLEQERTARDAECAALRDHLTAMISDIDDLGSPMDITLKCARRALGDQ